MPVYAKYLKGVLVGRVRAGRHPHRAGWQNGDHDRALPRHRRAKKPIVVNGHMDVVEANPQDWKRDPFTAVVEDGYVFGRGAVDNKFDVSMVTATLAHLKRSGWKPGRDVLLALSGDEETEMASTRKLAQDIKNAELVLNDDGGGGLLADDNTPIIYGIQAAEKTYADFTLTVTDPGGHSSRPGKTNAIYQLTRGLGRLADYQFPPMQNEITRAVFQGERATCNGAARRSDEALRRRSDRCQGDCNVIGRKEYIGQVRTTCVATEIQGGHAANALPQRATANVNCRIFPGTSVASVRRHLVKMMDDPEVDVSAQRRSLDRRPAVTAAPGCDRLRSPKPFTRDIRG